MQEIRRRRDVVLIGVRARLPLVARALALAVMATGLVYVGITYNRARKVKQFRMRGRAAELSTRVTSRVENFERRVTDNNRQTMLLRAALYLSYDDGHHELQTVHLEYYPQAGGTDTVNARQAVYFSETEHVQFVGGVRIDTRDNLQVQTERVDYNIKDEQAKVDVPVAFTRDNITGHADGALVLAKEKKLDLSGKVEITVTPKQQGQSAARSRPVTIRSTDAHFDQNQGLLVFTNGATAEQERDVMSGDTLTGWVNQEQKLNRIQSQGHAYLRTLEQGRAAEASAAEERSRLVNKILSVAERQRSGMAAELHDGPIQSLTRLGLTLDRGLLRLDRGQVEEGARLLADARKGLASEVQALRGIMATLRPPVLEERGLVSALCDYVEVVRQQAGISCTLTAKLPERLPEDQEIVLYRVAQEALTNVARHARASRARVELVETADAVVLEVHDDGVGFDPAAEPRGGIEHFGLAGMRERVELAGGTWTVWSRPGAGTVLTASLPKALVAA